MTQYQNKTFSVKLGGKLFAEGWEAIFGGKEATPPGAFVVAPDDESDDYCRGYANGYDAGEDGKSEAGDTAYNNGYDQGYADAIENGQGPARSGSITDYQKRVQTWNEHNFPLVVTDEHNRTALEHLIRSFRYVGSDQVAELAKLLAARESRNHRPLIGAVEELGELCHAHLKNEQGIRGTPEKWLEAKKDAIGDTLIYLMDYCNKEGLSMQECLEHAWLEVSGRDWVRFPKNGTSE